jgi:hypothetical protein
MGGRLAANIAARNPETGVVETFLAGETVPAWAAERITNPDVWAREGSDVGEVDADLDQAEDDTGTDTAPGVAADDEPPRTGKGSGKDHWAEYAQRIGVDVDQDASKADIIAAVDAAKG